MKKLMKKIIVGAFVGLFALQTTMISQAQAATDFVIATIKTDGVFDMWFIKGGYRYYPPINYWMDPGWEWINWVYDISDEAYTKRQVTGSQFWDIEIQANYDTVRLAKITLEDNRGNLITSLNYNRTIPDYDCDSYVAQLYTYILDYDLNYDGKVTLVDAQLAQKIALGTVLPSKLQILLGDTNGNGEIDTSDAEYILKVALKLV